MIGYSLNRLYEEVAFLAYHFHWDHETIMELEHKDRQRWCEEVSRINKERSGDDSTKSINLPDFR